MKKVMISQMMAGRSDREILEERERIAGMLFEKGYEVVDSFFPIIPGKEPEIRNKTVGRLAKAIEVMSDVDAVYFVPGWWNARGCRIEHEIAEAYGIEMLYGEGVRE